MTKLFRLNYLADEVIDDNKVNELLAKKYNETIVIAEDDSEILAYLKDELSTNFRVIAVNNGYDAVKAVMMMKYRLSDATC
ncbi:MAG: hypothetical protein ACLSGF_06300 [Alistipes onderdonkii]